MAEPPKAPRRTTAIAPVLPSGKKCPLAIAADDHKSILHRTSPSLHPPFAGRTARFFPASQKPAHWCDAFFQHSGPLSVPLPGWRTGPQKDCRQPISACPLILNLRSVFTRVSDRQHRMSSAMRAAEPSPKPSSPTPRSRIAPYRGGYTSRIRSFRMPPCGLLRISIFGGHTAPYCGRDWRSAAGAMILRVLRKRFDNIEIYI